MMELAATMQGALQGWFGPVWGPHAWTVAKSLAGIVAVLVPLLLTVLYYQLVERWVIGWIQVRRGPNRVGVPVSGPPGRGLGRLVDVEFTSLRPVLRCALTGALVAAAAVTAPTSQVTSPSTRASRQPASLEICSLLTKPGHKRLNIPLRYVGFDLPDAFVIGYGLDYSERWRNLPYIAVLELEDPGRPGSVADASQ